MSSIATVRATLSTLSVPSPNAPPSDLASTVAKSSMCKAQYGDARNKYLRQRVEEQMVDYVGTWDDEKGEFQQPEQHDDPNNGGEVLVFGCLGVWVFGCLGVWVFGCLGV